MRSCIRSTRRCRCNEELEAAKEETQSLNEELQTVNFELTAKIEAIDQLSDDKPRCFRA